MSNETQSDQAGTAGKRKDGADFPPTLAPMFRTRKNPDNLISPPLDQKEIDNLYALVNRKIEVGSSFFLRKAKRLSSKGEEYFYLDVLPPISDERGINRNTPVAATTGSDEV